MSYPPSRVLGYDIREASFEETLILPRQYRETFLFRSDVAYPLSIDTHIWPSIFAYPGVTSEHLSPRIPAPDCEGHLWSLFETMMRRATSAKGIAIAIELFISEDATVDLYPSPLIYSPATPNVLPDTAIDLGYDVADAGFWSGLSNMGFDNQELAQLRPKWAPKVNANGLIREKEYAFEFRQVSDSRVPEHAPFWVYRLLALETKVGDTIIPSWPKR